MINPYNNLYNKQTHEQKAVDEPICINQLPEEILVKIVSYLTVDELLICMCVDRKWNRLATEKWDKIFRDFKSPSLEDVPYFSDSD